MNHLSLSELCCLFCCPPCPSKITSKLAFLPPEPTYTLMCDESSSRWTLHLSERADWQYSTREKDAIECFMTRTSRGSRIACMFVRCSPNARYTLLFSHGNAVDLGQMSSFYIGLGSRINCNVFSYDYSGYGASSGKPSEKNLYADVDAAWHALRTRWEWNIDECFITLEALRVFLESCKCFHCWICFLLCYPLSHIVFSDLHKIPYVVPNMYEFFCETKKCLAILMLFDFSRTTKVKGDCQSLAFCLHLPFVFHGKSYRFETTLEWVICQYHMKNW